MYKINEIDQLEIFILMDNVSDPFSKSNKGIYWNESQYQNEIRERRQYSGADCCQACNGLSLFIKFNFDNKSYTILFDTGPDAGLAIENAERLGLKLQDIDAIILSHGHFDHYGGTISALDAIKKPDIPVFAHPEVFVPRAFGEDNLIYINNHLTKDDINKHGGKLFENKDPTFLFNKSLLLSGEIPRKTSYEKGVPDEFKLSQNEWKNSPEVIEEQCLIFNLKQKGLVVITGCGHTGIVNAAKYAVSLTSVANIHILMGGFHLASPKFFERIDPTIKDIIAINPNYIVTGHCTGRNTQAELSKTFGDKHIPYGVGARFLFDSEI